MVPLFVPEARWAPRSWGVNHPLYVRAQIEHGLDEARYGFWGFSPACRPRGGYRTYGVDALGTDPKGYTSNDRDVPAGRGEDSGGLRRRRRDPACLVPGPGVRPRARPWPTCGPCREVPDLRALRLPRLGQRLHAARSPTASWRSTRG